MDKPQQEIIFCSEQEVEKIKKIAYSRTASIWRIKRAKIILGTLEGRSVDQLVFDVRVTPTSIKKCQQRFIQKGLKYFEGSTRRPTKREASVERMLAFLEHPPSQSSGQWDELTVHYIGHDFTASQIKKIRRLIKSHPEYTRVEIGRQVCLLCGLYQSNGMMKQAAVYHILKRMDMDNIITLPPSKKYAKHTKHTKHIQMCSEPPAVTNFKLSELEPLRFIPVKTQKDSALWFELLNRYHYISGSRIYGAQMRYLVYSGKNTADPICMPHQSTGKLLLKGGQEHSADDWKKQDLQIQRGEHLLAVLGFGACAWRLSGRDEFIGWTDEQRVANLNLIVNNVRFLILPWIKSKNLASRILGGIAKLLPHDWEARNNYKPVLLETFVQLDQFKGTCYRAANWIQIGTTQGYSLYNKQKKMIPTKAIFLYPLHKHFRRILCNNHPGGSSCSRRTL